MVNLLSKRWRTNTPWSLGRSERKLLRTVEPYTMSDSIRLSTLHLLAKEVCDKGIEGDIVECGVCNGGSAAMMAAAASKNSNRNLWLYDTFEGIPAPKLRDGEFAQKFVGDFVGSERKVGEILEKVGYPLRRVVFKKGLFRETFKEALPTKVALLHIDSDWHESVLSALDAIYPAVSAGGIIVLDDFGHWEGTRQAFYEFCQKQNIQPLLERVGHTQAFWHKGAEHNRNLYEAFEHGVYHRS